MHSADGWQELLEPVVKGCQKKGLRLLFRGDAAFAKPELYEYLEQGKIGYAIRLPANQVIQEQIQPLLERPTEWPSREPIVSYHDFAYQAQSWHLPRRVVAKVEWHQGELFPRVGFIVTNLSYPPKGAADRPALGNRRPMSRLGRRTLFRTGWEERNRPRGGHSRQNISLCDNRMELALRRSVR